MNIKFLLAGVCACALLTPAFSKAEEGIAIAGNHHHGEISRADGHAPIGVMGDHMHAKGEWMVSYRYMRMHMEDNRDGTDELSDAEILATPNRFGTPANLRVIPEEMTTDMHMIGAMYAPTEWLTLMAMGNYLDRDMDHSTYNMAGVKIGEFKTKASGWGDTKVGGLFHLYGDETHHLHLNAGLSLPTGSIKEGDDVLTPMGMTATLRLPYAMQLGSGTYDLLPGITYSGHKNDWSWGGQYSATFRLGENSEDYALGDKHQITAWGSYSWIPSLSTSLRITGETEDKIDGIDSQIAAPVQTADPNNYGGERVSASLGMNYVVPKGFMKGHRFAVEATLPVYQDLNGPQLKRDNAIVFGWQKSF